MALDEELANQAMSSASLNGGRAVSFTFRASKKTVSLGAKGLKNIVKGIFFASRAGVRKLKGGQGKTIKQLSKDGSQIDMLDPVDKQYTQGFKPYAKKYDIEYSIMRHKEDKSLFTVFYKCKDVNKLEKALSEFAQDKGLDKDSLLEKLKNAREKSQQKNAQKAKSRTKTRSKNYSRQRGL